MPERRENVIISVGGKEWSGWSGLTIRRSADRFAEATFTAPFEPEREEFRKLFRPFGYAPVTVAIGGKTMLIGTMLGVTPNMEPSSRTVDVTCYSQAGVLNDVTMPRASYPLEFNGLTLRQIAEKCCAPFGIPVVFQLDDKAHAENAAYRVHLGRVAEAKRRIAQRNRVKELERIRDEYVESTLTPEPGVVAGWNAAVDQAKLHRDYAAMREAEKMRQKARLEEFTGNHFGVSETRERYVKYLESQAALAEARALAIPKFSGTALDLPFRRVAVKPDESVLGFLVKLAQQRNFIITDTDVGELLFCRSTPPGAPVAKLHEGKPPLLSVSATFSPQNMFSEMTAISKGRAGARAGAFTAQNPHLSHVTRPSTFSPDDTDSPDLEAAANARVGRMLASAASFEVEVPTWRDANGELWTENTTVSLLAPSAMIYRETEMLIRDVEFTYGESLTARLSLVLPGAFSGEIPEVMPWD